MILADTSAWIEFDRATGSAVDLRMVDLVGADGALAVTEPVIMEVTAGARTPQREHDLRRLLGRFQLLPFEVPTDFVGAAAVYRTCRRAGVTPRGLLDCMIAAVALRHQASVLQLDSDLAHVARVMRIPLAG